MAVLVSLRANGQLSRAHVARAAEGLGVGERTVWRWLSDGERVERPGRFELTDDDMVELTYWHGNVAAFRRARPDAPSLTTLYRAVARATTPGQRAGIGSGEKARREFDTYLIRQPKHRNEVWEADHCELAIEVLLEDGQVIKPWLTSFLDRYSRGLCGWAISGCPSQASVLGAWRVAILVEAPYGPIGGIPRAIRWDRGKEFLSGTIRQVALALAVDARALPGYRPHLKGAIEGLHETIETRLLVELPGFVHAPAGRAGRRARQSEVLLTLVQFIDLFAEFARSYNEMHVHDALDGEAPLQRWLADPTPLRSIDAAHLRHLMLARETRVVGKKGIRLLGSYYNCAELVGLVGETVEVRYMPHHHDRIEVFLRDRHIGTAIRHEEMGEDEIKRLIARRHAEERWLARHEAAAARQRRRRFAPVTSRTATQSETNVPAPKVLTPSRSLRMDREIPQGWVRPLTPEQVAERKKKEEKEHR